MQEPPRRADAEPMGRNDLVPGILAVGVAALTVLAWFVVAAAAPVPPERQASAVVYEVVDGDLVGARGDIVAQRLWTRFAELVPVEERASVSSFTTAVTANTAGHVEVVDGGTWLLALHPRLLDEPGRLDAAVVHELGHLVTLGADDRYLTAWMAAFWPQELVATWQRASEAWTGDRHAAMADFVETNADRFVTRYAASSPVEDLAESFTAYVLGTGTGDLPEVARTKVEFFDRYPELAELRAAILSRR